ncbi:ATP-dependent helicase HrpB [Paenibacillus bovis]|uniref:ATP-dependent helicase HrpB n=1 Tax=Paenibacillus bovis TaxID=1616788 RepID=A0A172ZGD9_9BACL|nr:ATP-dependent helicase HrpB [Paenibacillus bovis]ANF96721.1 ATP-dependent helicase HrpB [Paenibacillus bovis]
MLNESVSLPVDDLITDLKNALAQSGSAVLTAEPGAGKTTRLPLALRHESWLNGRRIIMLEPRRLAAISAARYMAAALGERVGETVGYRVAMDTRVGPRTIIEVVTEGVLTRMLQHDPSLEQAGLIILDEFHERNLHADLGLAFTLESKSLLREDLRILVMSATMDPEPVAALLGGAPVLSSAGRSYPVETYYEEGESAYTLYRRSSGRIEQKLAATIIKALHRHEGHALVFLPGVREIRRVQDELLASSEPLLRQTDIVMLHGGLKPEQQDLAVRPGPADRRKVVLATSLAESSVTVDGVNIVIDSGLMRTRLFSARTGMERMETLQVSVDAADQRRGRAGRQRPGVCYRMWSSEEHRHLAEARTPEILQSDLAPLALEVASWGTSVQELYWLDQPPAASYNQAVELLKQLEGLEHDGRITEHGRRLAQMGTHPRLGHMMLKAVHWNMEREACDIAALLQERDILSSTAAGIDLAHRLETLQGKGCYTADRHIIERIKEWSARFYKQLSHVQHQDSLHESSKEKTDSKHNTSTHTQYAQVHAEYAPGDDWLGMLVSLAYPDRIAKNRGDGKFLLRLGRGAHIPVYRGQAEYVSTSSYLVAAELDDNGSESRILLAAGIHEQSIRQIHADQIQTVRAVAYDAERESVSARKITRLGAIELSSVNDPLPSAEDIQQALLAAIRERGLGMLQWSRAALQLRQRIDCMHRLDPDYPSVDEQQLLNEAEEWLLPYLQGMRRLSEVKKLNPAELLANRLSWEQKQRMDQQVPTHIQVPSGSRIPIDYTDPERPSIAVRLQEMFGCTSTPLIGGRVPLTIQLLSPASRPVQVTNDLESFWKEAYFEVKKDLKGRYPKHYWPDQPLEAQATNRFKPRQ